MLPSAPTTLAPPKVRHLPVTVFLVGAILLGAAFRLPHLDYGSFSEDEINKVRAIRSYSAGHFSDNAEHPMLMKLAMWGSSRAAATWNRLSERTGAAAYAAEAALRLPNAVVGALTVIPLFFLTRSFFGVAVAAWAVLFFALDVNVAGINRIGKEDTFLLFFLLWATWLSEEARNRHLRDRVAPQAWYAASGAAFGLMLASKYMPYYLGLWSLYGLACPSVGRSDRRVSRWFYVAIAGAFILANPAILLPETWTYALGYVRGHTVTHHGAFFNGAVYANGMGATPFGLPWYFYLQYLVTKIPIAVLALVGIGLVDVWRRRQERGGVFLRVFLLLFLLPSSLVASKFVRYLLPVLVLLNIVAALGLARVVRVLNERTSGWVRQAALAGILAVALGTSLAAQVWSHPWPSLFQNAIGARLSAPGGAFPNDEIYDIGMREAVAWVAAHAAPGAALVSEASGVVAEYARRSGRGDLEVRSMTEHGTAPFPTENWLLVQDSHTYFESQPLVTLVRWRQQPLFTYRVAGAKAVEVFRLQ